MKLNKWLLSALLLAFASVCLFSVGTAGAAYVGSDTCGTCHTTIKTDFDKSGHPYKVRFTNGLTPVASGAGAGQINDPLSALLTGYTPLLTSLSTATNNALRIDNGSGRLDWSAVSYVIGGFGWKARWGILDASDLDADGVNDTGYVWTGSGAQYNMHTNNYSAYNSGADKKYSCAICHNTNGTSSVDAGCTTALGSGRAEPWASSGRTPANNGGFYSEWSLSGVQCEACHGEGSTHAGSPSTSNIVKNTSKDVCGKCHIRSTNTTGFGGECGGDAGAAILTNGAQNNGGTSLANQTVQHHEQYNELVGYNGDGAHASLDCVTCHNPHKRSHKVTDAIAGALGITDNNQSAEARGAVVSCGNCHYGKDSNGAANIAGHTAMACVDCHMAEIVKSATAVTGTWGVKGDVKGHIFAIDPAAATMDRTNADTKHIAARAMTVNFACGKCHDSAVGTATGVADAAAATAAATNYHGAAIASIDNGYVGSNVCGSCHTSKYDDFIQSGHPYKVRFTNGRTPYDNSTCEPGTVAADGKICDPLSTLLTGYTPLLTSLSTATNNALRIDNGTGRLDWSAVSYVIGGFGWKARWGILDASDLDADGVNDTGYVWTGSGAQYNMHTNNYSAYNSGADKKYSCAICHNTNGTSSVDAGCTTALGSGRTEPWASTGLTSTNSGGFKSEWTFSGVQCEACHGAGLNHATAASASNITKNTSKDACGTCHIRSTNTTGFGGECGGNAGAAILTNGAQNNGGTGLAGQMVQHHEQYNELVGYNGNGVHASLNCVDCHDPHKRSHKVTDAIAGALGITDNSQSAEARGAVVSCNTCHGTGGSAAIVTTTNHPSSVTCIDCHMAETTKSATAETGTWGAKADVKGHIFAIDTTATTMDTTNAGGKHIATNYITVNFACGKCHDSTVSFATGRPAFTQAQAQLYAKNIHNSNPTASFSWSTDATTPYKINVTASGCPTGDTCTYDWTWGDATSSTGVATAATSKTYAATTVRTVTLVINDATTGGTSAPTSRQVGPVNVVVTPPATSKYTVSGKVVRLDGTTAVANASVRLKASGVLKKLTATKADGTYTLTDVVPGTYDVEVVKTGLTYTSQSVTVVAANLTGINFTGNR